MKQTGKKGKKGFWFHYSRNRLAVFGLCFLVFISLSAILADYVAPYGYDDQNIVERLQAPSAKHWFGTDKLGRDVFSRMIYGGRISLGVGIASTLIGTSIALIIGMISGFYGKWVDTLIMRTADIFLAIPSILLAIGIAAIMGGGIISMLIAISIGSIPGVTRLIRALVMTQRNQEYIEAARTARASDFRIMTRYILPNIVPTLIVTMTMGFAGGILNASTLSFIGLGAQAPIPEWGALLSEGRANIRDCSYLVTYPGLAIMLTVFSFNMMGDGVRDALDPKLKGRK